MPSDAAAGGPGGMSSNSTRFNASRSIGSRLVAGTGSRAAFWAARAFFSFAVVSCGSSSFLPSPFLPLLGRPRLFFGTALSSSDSSRTANY